MLPTPSTDHVSFRTIYEPAEDSFLFLDTLSSATESTWLRDHFDTQKTEAPPLVVEVGAGSGVVLAFAAANAGLIFGRKDVLAVGVDVNADACEATRKTVNLAIEEKLREEQAAEQPQGNGVSSGQRPRLLATLNANLCTSFNDRSIDVLLFNPPYVPTPELPSPTKTPAELASMSAFDRESYLLELSYAGGDKGMEITDRLLEDIPRVLSERGVAYVLFCKQNQWGEVQERIRWWEGGGKWRAEVAGDSGVKAGWEKLVILRIWRASAGEGE